MNLSTFERTLGNATSPAGMDPAVQALWWAGRHDWDRAHDLAQQNEGDPACDWVHAHLHRVEGDAENAAYWYGRAGKPVATGALDTEWAAIAGALVGRVDGGTATR